MLNLLWFRATADYPATPAPAPASPISGEAAYRLYVEHTLPHLRRSGGDVRFYGRREVGRGTASPRSRIPACFPSCRNRSSLAPIGGAMKKPTAFVGAFYAALGLYVRDRLQRST